MKDLFNYDNIFSWCKKVSILLGIFAVISTFLWFIYMCFEIPFLKIFIAKISIICIGYGIICIILLAILFIYTLCQKEDS